MYATKEIEARIITTNNILLLLSKFEDESLIEDFCGLAIALYEPNFHLPDFTNKTVYLCGDISKIDFLKLELEKADRVFAIEELSSGCDLNDRLIYKAIDLSKIPLLVHGVGIYYRNFFDSEVDYFHRICAEHTFQSLTESNKPGTAHRTGIYLTPIEQDGEDLHFRLLRCSTNLSGATDNFRVNDRHIVDALNQETAYIFANQAPLNHVLAQIYPNTPATDTQKQTKAKIKAHADKTKDMPSNGIMAFCTFYDGLDKLEPLTKDACDLGYKNVSGLTKLNFRLKASVANRVDCTLPERFTVTLYPNSVFFMSLSTNRLYTHEIKSSVLDADRLPTRLGYVVRCSNAEAVHKNGQTFLKKNGRAIELKQPTPEGIKELRQLYAEENKSDRFIDYGDKFLFSMNKGDYLAPHY